MRKLILRFFTFAIIMIKHKIVSFFPWSPLLIQEVKKDLIDIKKKNIYIYSLVKLMIQVYVHISVVSSTSECACLSLPISG